MHDQVNELIMRGRELPLDERKRHVDSFLEFLNEGAAAALAPLWEAEIEKRLAEYDCGEVKAIDFDVVFAKTRKIAEE